MGARLFSGDEIVVAHVIRIAYRAIVCRMFSATDDIQNAIERE